MAITQARMIALLNAARDYQQAFTRLVDLIDTERGKGQVSPKAAQDALEVIYLSAGDRMLLEANTKSIILDEYNHFHRNWRRNDRNAAKATLKRLEAGIVPKHIEKSTFLRIGAQDRPGVRTPQLLNPFTKELEDATKPRVDLSHDEGDPENFSFSVQADKSLIIEGETDADRAARRAMVEDALKRFGPKAEPVDYSKLPQVISEKDEKSED